MDLSSVGSDSGEEDPAIQSVKPKAQAKQTPDNKRRIGESGSLQAPVPAPDESHQKGKKEQKDQEFVKESPPRETKEEPLPTSEPREAELQGGRKGKKGKKSHIDSPATKQYAPLIFERKKKPKKLVGEDLEVMSVPVKLVDESPVPMKEEEDELDDWEAMAEQLSEEESAAKGPEQAKGEPQPAPEPETVTTKSSSPPHPAPVKGKGKKQARNAAAQEALNQVPEGVPLRSPILCIMGHVDTGKTKLLDKIRRTNVQDKEAGGITQQIGATFFPRENLIVQCNKVEQDLQLRVPGLLIIDTPGHASFNNLRKRGSSLCDIAILVVDIMHGLEPQTRESIGLLRSRKCPFVVALNKIDRLYGWVTCEWQPCKQAIDRQKRHVKEEFEDRARKVLLQLTSEESLNCEIYWRNPNVRKNVSVVPTSAITGEGIPDLLTLIVKLTQQLMVKQIVLDTEHIECTVLEVKGIEGLGTTIDVILISGVLHEGDTIVVCGMSGPIVTTIRALLTPHPMKELRVKGEYIHHETLSAAMGVKIAGNGLEDAVAGTAMMVAKNPNDLNEIRRLKEEVQEDMGAIFKSVDKTQEGVYVIASTLGSLEALLDFLKESHIPVSGINIGTVWKLDVKKASTMRERGHEEYSVILAFDVKIDPEAEKEAKILGVKIFSADIIYHLFDAFTKHIGDFREEQKKQATADVVFPCVLSILPQFIFNKKDPLVLGIKVDDGELRMGTPVVVFKETDMTKLGTVASIELNKKSVEKATKGQEVCIKITGDTSITYGRHFDHTQKIYSQISRTSINIMKQFFKEDLEKVSFLFREILLHSLSCPSACETSYSVEKSAGYSLILSC
eukprot:Blabericola_migrator_1__9690@NODE_52_length_16271_cov_146_860775_g48_i0_p2_GENE_NODE_52_length_16271_cov_146_860775_g48_i0NODE_52_length_16271_cov_146_860775_g48_i0_p2_ORF_typecomplete_len844_score147_07GTP_EFTU/PF00009_27/2_1e40GTP_EFTU_D4/PF14578_6/3_9e03GTP_EFTU_D4/PF14578_6/1_4e26IF2/PF11987_8/1_8e25GTP_EFTU_D2/PF03144_25/3_7e03GTP_EFTU_D2/PF03144_25/5e12GTP_EFTU_D2/PF03144_25/1Arf/PF00025_21/6_1e06FeoB_N/PF02421_18/0_001FeoB_N/PF02421_18/1_3e02FeoB_N/PF02421_18/1_2e03Ras/PF00071_22/7e05Ras/